MPLFSVGYRSRFPFHGDNPMRHITKDWKEASSFAVQINLYGFWDGQAFLSKSGDLGDVFKIGGMDCWKISK
jgi:hypothetical protein